MTAQPTTTPVAAPSKEHTSVPRLALTKVEAAACLGVSVDTLEREVIPELRVVRLGRRVLVPVRELERWTDRRAAR